MKFTEDQANTMYEILSEILCYWEQFLKVDKPLVIDDEVVVLEGTDIQAPWSIKPPDRDRPWGWMTKGMPMQRNAEDGFVLSDVRFLQLFMAELKEHLEAKEQG